MCASEREKSELCFFDKQSSGQASEGSDNATEEGKKEEVERKVG